LIYIETKRLHLDATVSSSWVHFIVASRTIFTCLSLLDLPKQASEG